MTSELVCYACGERAAFEEGKRCSCGEPRWFDVDASAFEWPDEGYGTWRYESLLPVTKPDGIDIGAGGTPLVRASRLDEYAGCRVHVKDEGQNPTGSFKDRGSTVGAAYAAEHGREWVGTVSHGNMAMSMAAHAAAHSLECAVLVPEGIPSERLNHIDRYNPTTLRVRGDYGRLYYRSLEIGADVGVEFVNSDTPLRVAGQKTVALELCEQFDGTPEAIVMPASSGGLASATWKALRELETAGLLETMPRMYLVQSAACSPIADAYQSGADEVSRVEGGETIAYSIANADPPSGTRALTAVRETDGAALGVTDDGIRNAQQLLAERAGLRVETASAVPLAGARELSEHGEIDANEEIAIVATGSGFKETTDTEPPTPDIVDESDVHGRLRTLANDRGPNQL